MLRIRRGCGVAVVQSVNDYESAEEVERRFMDFLVRMTSGQDIAFGAGEWLHLMVYRRDPKHVRVVRV